MTMRKAVLLAGLALMFGAGTASAAEGRNVGKWSVGYQGVDLNTGGSSILSGGANGISTRYWINNEVGVEGNLYYLSDKQKSLGYEWSESTLAVTVKGLYAPVVKENSRFYVGLEAGLGRQDFEETGYTDLNNDFWLIRPLIGAEYNLAGIPELGINFEVGYLFGSYDADATYHDPATDYSASGISIGAGVHYYF